MIVFRSIPYLLKRYVKSLPIKVIVLNRSVTGPAIIRWTLSFGLTHLIHRQRFSLLTTAFLASHSQKDKCALRASLELQPKRTLSDHDGLSRDVNSIVVNTNLDPARSFHYVTLLDNDG